MLFKCVSWNVNGLRAVSGKPEWEWFARTDAQVVALQETKAHPEQLNESVRNPGGWEAHWSWSTGKKGYSGVAVFSKAPALHVQAELPQEEFQGEGRLLHLEYPQFHFSTATFPTAARKFWTKTASPRENSNVSRTKWDTSRLFWPTPKSAARQSR